MSKYIIEIPDDVQYVLLNGKADNKYYTAVRPIAELEELNSDYINEHFGELQDDAYKQGYADAERIWRAPSSDNEFYQKGLEDAWEAARRIVVDTAHGGIALSTLGKIFGTQTYSCIMRDNTAQEAIAKLKAYEEKREAADEIKVGDEVEVLNSGNKYLIAWIAGTSICGFSHDGITCHLQPSDVRKTGRHFDIQSILGAMKS